MRNWKTGARILCLSLVCGQPAFADWPMLRGNAQHSGFISGQFQRSFRLSWVREIEGERLGTAMEPIVAHGKVFVATHSGNLYALHADSGEPIWRFQALNPFLHSPAVTGAFVVVGNTDGNLYAVDAASGKLAWKLFAGRGGFSASPTVADGIIYVGTRAGDFLAVSGREGRLVWRQSLGVPVRQTAALADGQVFVTAEDLRVRCFDALSGKILWVSDQLQGQTARDYYPVVVMRKGRTYLIVRTNPVLNMAQRIGRDRTLLSRNAGLDDSNWQKLEAWIKSDQGRGNADLWAKEREAVGQYLATNLDARTLFVLDARTGKEEPAPPVLWVGGCQGVGPEPALTADGRMLVLYRSAYGNWNRGVAPLVALGLLDLETNQVTPLFHQQGPQPSWNCFWGTADESQNFLVVGDTALIIHQGTLSGFDLSRHELFPIWGERDTFGGFHNPPWARNEWHGPARGGVAVVDRRIYWLTGSRILCLVKGDDQGKDQPPKPQTVAKIDPSYTVPAQPPRPREQLRKELNGTVAELLARPWAPLFTDPGLAGRLFLFENSSDLFEALAWAFPHLTPRLQEQARSRLREEWDQHPPFAASGSYSLDKGFPRELFPVPAEYRRRLGHDLQPHPFGNVASLCWFAQRCNEETLVIDSWPKLKGCYEEFMRTGWRLEASKGDPFANRYLASLLAFSRLAQRCNNSVLAGQALAKANETGDALVAWWDRVAKQGNLRTFDKSAELDPFIGKGDGLFWAVAPHWHKLALFQDLTPEVAALVRSRSPHSGEEVWRNFIGLCPTWPLVGEERQVHFGENFVDPPDFALSAFRALAWLKQPGYDTLSNNADLPFCRADLAYLMRLALALESK